MRLRHGSILGLAEGITGAPYAWTSIALEDVTVKTIPMDKVLRDLERANSGIAGIVRRVQTGHLYWYALVMILGVFALMTWFVWGDFFMQLIK